MLPSLCEALPEIFNIKFCMHACRSTKKLSVRMRIYSYSEGLYSDFLRFSMLFGELELGTSYGGHVKRVPIRKGLSSCRITIAATPNNLCCALATSQNFAAWQ